MPQIRANGIRLEYDTIGDAGAEPLLLVMGLGAQLIHWRREFCEHLADAGHYVIRFDNRDAGLSEKFGHLGVPDMAAIAAALVAGETPPAPYTLDDMAADAAGLLEALRIEAAHVCGASLGGMVAQTLAINHPERVATLTSIMSSTGNPALPPATEEAMAALLSPAATERDAAVARSLYVSGVIGSPKYPTPEAVLRERAVETFDRGVYPEGVARQMAAVAAHGDRRERLRRVEAPALVIHGADDPLVRVEAAHDTHGALADCELLVIDGMGHDLPEVLWPQIVEGIRALTRRSPVAGAVSP